jgi:hypothetical protein
MVELRSGTTTGGDNPRTPGTTRDSNIPENIEVVNQVDQGEIVDQGGPPQDTNQDHGQTPAVAKEFMLVGLIQQL